MMYNSRLKMILKYKQSQHRGREGRIELNDRYNRYSFPKMENLQSFHQELFTFPREVLSCIINPDLISNQTVNSDARKRAKSILDVIISAGSYTTSLGIPFIRQTVSNFIAQTDNVAPPKIDNIFLTEGATQGVHLIIKTLISNGDNAVMVPIPNYPLYPASISLNGGEMVPY
jgi:alanine transaminase